MDFVREVKCCREEFKEVSFAHLLNVLEIQRHEKKNCPLTADSNRDKKWQDEEDEQQL